MSPDGALTLSARGPFQLGAVAVSHGWFQTAPFAWDAGAGELARTERIDGAATTLRIRGDGDDGVRVRSGGADGAQVAARVRRMLQLDADLSGFAEAAEAVDPVLAADLTAHGCGRMMAGTSLFEDLVKALCGTNTSWRQAVAAINRIGGLGADGAFPEPAELLRGGEDWLRAEGRVGYRAGSLLDAARAAIDGRLAEIEALSEAGDGEGTHARLQELRGVGPATAGFLVLLMGHFDRPSIDSATLRVAAEEWFDGRRPRPREVRERIAPAGAYAGLVLAWATMRSWQRETGLSG